MNDQKLQLLTADETASVLRVSRATLYRLCKNDARFPTPVRLTRGCTRWRADQLHDYIKGLSLSAPDG
jgi:predicted DNA-binding transcriptional regulator AlpA